MRKKARLTITLSRDLVQQVDGMVDGRGIRSRSHAIESLLRQSLMPAVSSAVILAGGRPKGDTPAPLIEIDGRPLIRQQIAHLPAYDIGTIFIAAGPHEAAIREVVGDGSRLGTSVIYVAEEAPLGTAGALKLVEAYVRDAPLFLVMHGDVLTDIDVADFIAFHQKENVLASMAVKPRRAEGSYGKVLLQGNRITHFLGRRQDEGVSIVNAGVYLLRPEVLTLIEAGRPASLENEIFPRLAKMGELSAFLFQGIWFDVSTPQNLRMAQERWRQKESG